MQPFVLCGPSFKTLSRTCLLGVIQCDLEKKSVDHSLKAGQKELQGVDFLFTYTRCVCQSASESRSSCLLPFMDARLCFFSMDPQQPASCPTPEIPIVVTVFPHPFIGEEGGERVTAYCYGRMPGLRRAASVLCPVDPQPAQRPPQTRDIEDLPKSPPPLEMTSYLLAG